MSMFRCNIMQRVIPLSRVLFLSALLLGPLTALASIVDTGDVVESGGNLDIGTTAYGKREITDETVSYIATRLGNTAGIRGELFLINTQYMNTNELVVGASGEGLFNLVRDDVVQANTLTVGKDAGARGSIAIASSTFDLGMTGTAIIGDAGSGSIALDNAQFSNTIFGATFKTNRLTLGAQASGNGSLNLSCLSSVQIGGDSPVFAIGDYGIGSVNLYSGDQYSSCSPGSLVVQSSTTGLAQTYIARKPGSTGALNLTGSVSFNGGNLMRIGLDELDQPGGMGTLNVNPLYDPTQGLTPTVSAILTKIGPQGILNLNSALDTHDFISVRPSSLTGNVENWGALGGAASTTLYGNLVNHAKLVGLESGITCGCVSQEGLTVTGNFAQTATGQHNVKIIAGQFGAPAVIGTFTVQGTAHYDGNVNVVFQSGVQYQVTDGEQFTILSVPSGNATYEPTFAVNIDTSGLAPAFIAVADVSSTGIVVRIVTNPSVSADLAISMTDTPDPVLQGQMVNYTIGVTNNGPSPATSIAVNGTLSSCYFSSIASGATATCTRTATATAAGTLTQTMSVSGNEPDPNTANNSASVNTTVNPAANLGIAMTDIPDPVLQGQTVSYDITVTNNGPSTATGVVVSGSLPGCTLGNIAPGATASCTQTATATSVGTLTQTMTVSGNEADPNTANNTASVSTAVNPAADLALSMTDTPDPVKKRAKLVYTLTVVNNGPSSANNVSLTDTLPADTIFDGAVPSQGTCSGTATVTCAIGTLGSGAIATVTITVKPKVTGTITNSATVSATDADPDIANNTATATTSVSGGGKP